MQNRQATRLLFEMSHAGRRAHRLPAVSVPGGRSLEDRLPAKYRAASPPPLPELAEGDVVRHFTVLSTRNMSVDTNFYPLGSCTMKYNPKRNERLASLPGLVDVHPQQRSRRSKGCCDCCLSCKRCSLRSAACQG